MKRRLEIIANVTVIVVALAVGFVVLSAYARSYRTPPSIAAGDRLASIPGVDWKQHQRTLVLALNANCHYCEDSVPFYQNLAAAIRQGKESVDAVALFPNEAETVRQFTAHEGLTMRSVPGVPLEKLRINATPTVILVNNQGRVERSWVGILTPRQENDLLKLAAGL